MNKLFSVSKYIILIVTTCLVVFLNTNSSKAQTVSTFVTGSGLNGPDGFALDSLGNLFVANWGGGSGTTILKVTGSAVVTTFNSTLNAPDGLAFDALGNLFVSNYGSGIINKITPDGVKNVFASGFTNPSALAFDTEGNLYVSNHGGNTVSKITPDGTVTVYASGFNAPLGLVFDPEGNLYVSNYNSGIINKVDQSGTVTVFATVPNPASSKIQYLVRGPSGNLYLPSYGHNKIYKISTAGVVSVFAGTGIAGDNNGPVATAQFNGPNSIALSQDGDIFVSEYNVNRIRKITGVEPVTSIEGRQEEIPEKILLMQNYPNPFNPETTISYKIQAASQVSLKVYDVLGRIVATLVDEFKQPGNYKAIFNVETLHATSLPSGIYLYRLNAGSFYEIKKMMLLK